MKKTLLIGEGNRHASIANTDSPKQDECKQAYSKTYYNKRPKVKDKERILKATREKQSVTYGAVPKRLSANFSKETL